VGLQQFEIEILHRMYHQQIISYAYLPTQTIERRINWTQLRTEYRIKKKFPSIMQRLKNKGYLDDHGKSGNVYSLTFLGVAYVKATTT
jgi:hypothetical protein